MILLNQFPAALLLLSLTLCLQCAGVTTLIVWQKRVLTRDIDRHGQVYSAALDVWIVGQCSVCSRDPAARSRHAIFADEFN
jgi:hypothetical protein